MEAGDYGTTPFGRRPMTLALVQGQKRVESALQRTRCSKHQHQQQGRAVDKWALYRDLCVAKDLIGASDRALAVLSALLSFYPDDELSQDNGLIVFPSNRQLCLRAHGMAGTTLRRHLAALVECGLIVRRDSPNGKRYAHKSRAGEVEEAFGLSLAPLLARADEIARAADEVRTEALLLKRTRERITLQRRDITKLIEAAMQEGASGDWRALHTRFRAVVDAIPRRATILELAPILENLDAIREEVDKLLETFANTRSPDGNVIQNERQQTESNPDSHFDLEPAFEKERGEIEQPAQPKQNERNAQVSNGTERSGLIGAEPGEEGQEQSGEASAAAAMMISTIGAEDRAENASGLLGKTPGPGSHIRPPASRTYPLPLILKACPDIIDYGTSGAIDSWRDLVNTAGQVRTYLGISPSAWDEACETMGEETASIVIACILQRVSQIQSAGGYLRALTEKARAGEFSIGPMLMAGMKGKRQEMSRDVELRRHDNGGF